MLATLESGATCTFATLALAPRFWRVALFGTAGWAALHGHETLTYCPLNGTPTEQVFPVTDLENAELEAFATAVAGGAPNPLPLDEAIHGVSVYETMIHAAGADSAYAVACRPVPEKPFARSGPTHDRPRTILRPWQAAMVRAASPETAAAQPASGSRRRRPNPPRSPAHNCRSNRTSQRPESRQRHARAMRRTG